MVSLQRIKPREWRECIVAATGPSLTEAVAERCRGQHVIAVNDAYRRMPWAEVLYAGDRDWWEVHRGCPDFAGEKWTTHDGRENDKSGLPDEWGLHIVAGAARDGFSFDPGLIHYGSNSGFQAINLAILFGVTRIRLVGFDMRTTEPRHFFGDHPAPLHNVSKYEHFIPAFVAGARSLPPTIEIVNCTPGSGLRCFPQASLEEVLA